jgi:predicted regulator of Ras-like GTPase activity (Roadblock/LC7/MglB family)
MAELESIVEQFRKHEGVEHVLLAGRDGLLVHHSGVEGLDGETIAALAPGLAASCEALGDAAQQGSVATVAIEWEHGVGIVASISADLLLVLLLRQGLGFAPLLRSIQEQRGSLAELV